MKKTISVGQNQDFSSIQQAIDFAEKTNEPISIKVSKGTYFFDKPLLLTQSHSNLEISAIEGEKVTFSGSLVFDNPVWMDYEDNPNIKYTFIGKNLNIDGFFVNDQPQINARFPNCQQDIIPLGGVVNVETIKMRSKNWKNPSTGYVRALHVNGWGGNDYIINGFDADSDTGLSLRWVGDNNRGSDLMESSVMVENIFEELDAENEWFYDKNNGNFYYYPNAKFDLNVNTVFEASVCSEFFKLEGEDSTNPVKNISIKGINFKNTKRTLFSIDEKNKQYVPLLRGDWAVVKAGVIYTENAENICIQNCTFTNIGGNAIFMYDYNKNNIIDDNDFCNLGASAIQLVGNSNAVDDPSFWQHDLYPNLQVHAGKIKRPEHVGPVNENYPRDILVTNNYIEDIGVYEKQSAGINVSVASRIKILHNTINKSARSNININDGSFGGHEIAYNDIFNSQIETMDHGPFNSWGRDRFWSVPRYNASGEFGETIRNYTNDGKTYYDTTLLDAYQTTTIHDNRFHHAKEADHTWGIDLDDGSSNYEVFNNLCLGLGIKLREGFNRKVYNNIVIDGKIEIHVPYAQSKDEVFSNLVVTHQPWNFIAVDEERFVLSEYAVDKNWYYNFAEAIDFPSWYHINDTTKDADKNAIINENPLFEDPHNNNYTVSNSEVMDKIGFKNFAMNQFGKKTSSKSSPIYAKTSPTVANNPLNTYEWNECELSDITDSIISATASFGKKGAFFSQVKTDSKPFQMGFRKGDIVKTLNNKRIENAMDFISVMGTLTGEIIIKFEIHRECHVSLYEFNNLPES